MGEGKGRSEGSLLGGALGFLGGIALTLGYIHSDLGLPAPLNLGDEVKAVPERILADYFIDHPGADLAQRQRAVAVLLRDPEWFTRLDTELDYAITRKVVADHVYRRLHRMRSAALAQQALPPALLAQQLRHRGVADTRGLAVDRIGRELARLPFITNYLGERCGARPATALARMILDHPWPTRARLDGDLIVARCATAGTPAEGEPDP